MKPLLKTGCYYMYVCDKRLYSSNIRPLYFKVLRHRRNGTYEIRSVGGEPLFNGKNELEQGSRIEKYSVEINKLTGLLKIGA